MAYRHLPLAALAIFTMNTVTLGEVINPVPKLADVANEYKARAKEIKLQLVADIMGGGDVDTATRSYEEKKGKLFEQFAKARSEQYKMTRITEQQPGFSVERDTVLPTQARPSTYAARTYEAPDLMLIDNIEINPTSEIGDTGRNSSISRDMKSGTVTIHARSRYTTEGRSIIRVQPIVTWRYDIPKIVANESATLKKLLFE